MTGRRKERSIAVTMSKLIDSKGLYSDYYGI